MTFTFVMLCLLAMVALCATILFFVARRGAKSPHVRKIFWATIGSWALFAITLCFGSLAIVGANAVGINVGFGTYYGALSSGPHFVAPWSTVEEFSTRQQTAERNLIPASGDQPENRNCVVVKASGVEACVDTTMRWNIRGGESSTASIESLWRIYGTFDQVTEKLINNEINTTFAIVYGGYAPTDAYSGVKTEELSTKLKERLTTALAPYGITVEGLTLGTPNLDPDDQEILNRLFTAEQNVVIAEQEALAALQVAEANRNLQGSLTPEVLVQRCFDAAVAIRPTVFDCDLTGSSSTPVIVGQTPPA